MKIKRALFLGLSFLGIIFVYYSREEISSIFYAVSDTKLRWLFVAIIVQLAVYFFITESHRLGLKAVGVDRTRRQLLPLILSALVVNSTAPSGGTSGTILFINDSKSRGESGAKTGTGIMLTIITNFVALFAILLGVMFYLFIKRELGATEVVSATILFGIIVTIYSLLLIAKSKPDAIERFFKKINDFVFRIRKFFYKKARNKGKWTSLVTEELHNASASIHDNPIPVLKTFLSFLAAHFLNVATIAALFVSFGLQPKVGVIISGYAIGELFKIVSPSPEGIGVTEVSMAIVYSSFGVNPIVATSIALIYRGLNFWIPFGLGFFYLQRDHLSKA